MSSLHEYPSKPGALSAPRRNNYYFGKLMDVVHFQLEQNYGNSMRRMLNRLSLGQGVLCGLLVEKSADGRQICVGAGVAIDSFGREIIVSAQACIDPWTLTDECGQAAGLLKKDEAHVVYLCVAYRECGADFAPVLVEDCNLKQECAPGTIVESFRLLVQEKLPAPPPDKAAICDALLDSQSAYGVEATVEIGGKPLAVTVSPSGRRALVVNETSTGLTLLAIDVESGEVTPLTGATLEAPLGGVSVAPDGGQAFVTHAKGIVIVDLESDLPAVSLRIPSTKPYGACAAVAGGKVLYAIDKAAKKVDCIDVPASAFGLAISVTIDTGGGPADLAVSPNGQWLYIADLLKKKLIRVATATNTIVAGAAKTIDANSRTLAVRGGPGTSEAFVAGEKIVHRVGEDGTETKTAIVGDAFESAFTTSGGRYYVLNRAGTAHELVVFATAGMTEIARIEVGDDPTSVAVVPDSRRALVTNAKSGTISIVDVVPRQRLCEALSAPCPQPMGCPCVTLAAIELQKDGTIGKIDACGHRQVLYSNEMLLEFILCLAARLEECCPAAPVAKPPEPLPPPEGLFRIEQIEFLAQNRVVARLGGLATDPQFPADQRVSAIRVVFNRAVDLETVTVATSALDHKKASFLVRRSSGRDAFVRGRIVSDGPMAVRFVTEEPGQFQAGDYTAALFGDPDTAAGRPAIVEKSTRPARLDGERGPAAASLPSGEGNEGGNFKFKFAITD